MPRSPRLQPPPKIDFTNSLRRAGPWFSELVGNPSNVFFAAHIKEFCQLYAFPEKLYAFLGCSIFSVAVMNLQESSRLKFREILLRNFPRQVCLIHDSCLRLWLSAKTQYFPNNLDACSPSHLEYLKGFQSIHESKIKAFLKMSF